MKLNSAKIICFSALFMTIGLSQVSKALNYSNSIYIYNQTSELISKEGGGAKKSGAKKSGAKKSGAKKNEAKKSGAKKNGVNEKGDKETKSNSDKVQSNNAAMKEKAKERYKKWKDNRKAEK